MTRSIREGYQGSEFPQPQVRTVETLASPYDTDRRRHLYLVPPRIEEPAEPEPFVEAPAETAPCVATTEEPDAFYQNVMNSVIYAAIRGEYSNVDSEAFMSQYDPFATPNYSDETSSRHARYYDGFTMGLNSNYLFSIEPAPVQNS